MEINLNFIRKVYNAKNQDDYIRDFKSALRHYNNNFKGTNPFN